MSKAFISGLAIGLALLVVVGVGASKLRQKNAEQEYLGDLFPYSADNSERRP